MKLTDAPAKENRPIKLATYFAIFLLLLGLVSAARFLSWQYAKDDVLEIKNAPVPVRTIREVTHPQGVVILLIDYCKKINVTGKTRISFVSETREVFLPVSEDKAGVGCNFGQDKPTEIPIIIPMDLPPDTYRIHFRVAYDINPVKRGIIEEFDSLEFKVED